jgi:hypothetical protein
MRGKAEIKEIYWLVIKTMLDEFPELRQEPRSTLQQLPDNRFPACLLSTNMHLACVF